MSAMNSDNAAQLIEAPDDLDAINRLYRELAEHCDLVITGSGD